MSSKRPITDDITIGRAADAFPEADADAGDLTTWVDAVLGSATVNCESSSSFGSDDAESGLHAGVALDELFRLLLRHRELPDRAWDSLLIGLSASIRGTVDLHARCPTRNENPLALCVELTC